MNLYIFFTLLCVSLSESYKILIVFPLPFHSLNTLGAHIAKHLHDAGHEITFMTPIPYKNKPAKNFHEVDISGNFDVIEDGEEYNITNIITKAIKINDLAYFQEWDHILARHMFTLEPLKKFLSDPTQHFDVVISDVFEAQIFAGFASLYNCPLIFSYSMAVQWSIIDLLGDPPSPAYSTDYLSPNTPPLTFTQRVDELWRQLKGRYLKRFFSMPIEEAIYREGMTPYFKQRGRTLPPYEDVMYNASIIFANFHYAAGPVPATPQNLRFIGGQHIETPVKPLPKDLQTLMDNAKDGVIYFSIGSIWKSKDIPEVVKAGLLKVFGELKQTVLWKFEDKRADKPDNVHFLSWAPQQSILAHPNCKLFISHGGLLSSNEAVHAGVPVIGIPLFIDQFVNINRAVASGYAIKVDMTFDTHIHLKSAIQTILTDDRYTKRAKELSYVFNNRIATPQKEIQFWVDHVVKTRGAVHLRSPARNLYLYQKLYLDLLALILAGLVALSVAVVMITKMSFKKKTNVTKKNQ